jgi:hypothetical protein
MVLAATLLAGGAAARAQTPAPAAGGEAAAEDSAVDPAALAAIRRAGDFLRGQERFGFEAEVGYEAVQDDGHTLEFGATRHVWVERPDRFRMEAEDRDGDTSLVVFDGQALSASDPRNGVYAQAVFPTPRDLDDAVAFARRALALPLPLGELLRNDPNDAILTGLTRADRIGVARIAGVPCDHVAIANPDTDAQLWIAQGDEPTLRRIVITYRSAEGAPSFWADLRDWSFPSKLDADRFRFEPPAGAERIPFALRGEPPTAAAATGDRP